MRVLVTGDRNWQDESFIRAILAQLKVEELCHGGARGADVLSGVAARALNIPFRVFPAKWKEHGRAAGPIRNREMFDTFLPDVVIAFHDNLAESKGTRDMVMYAERNGCVVWHYKHEN